MVRVVLLVRLIPRRPMADSAMSLAVLVSVGRALFPTWHSASAFRCSNLTSTVGNWMPTLHHNSMLVR